MACRHWLLFAIVTAASTASGCRKSTVPKERPGKVPSAAPAPQNDQPQGIVCPGGGKLETVDAPFGRTTFCRSPANVIVGPVRTSWPTGRPRREGVMLGGLWHGPYTEWNEAGQVTMQGSFQNNRRTGPWKTTRRTEKGEELVTTVIYAEGLLVGEPEFESSDGQTLGALEAAAWVVGRRGAEWTLVSDGSKVAQGKQSRGLRDGVWTSWFDEKARAAEVSYRRGARDGTFRTWWPDGRLAVSGRYHKGEQEDVITHDVPSAGDSMEEVAQLAAPLSQMFVRCEVLLATTGAGQLDAIDPANGKTLWQLPLAGGLVGDLRSMEVSDPSNPTQNVCLVGVQTDDGAFRLVGAKDGKERSSLKLGTKMPIAIRRSSNDGIVVSEGRTVRQLDWRTGKEVGVVFTAKADISAPAVATRDHILLGDVAGNIYDLERRKDDEVVATRKASVIDVHTAGDNLLITTQSGPSEFAIHRITNWASWSKKHEESERATSVARPQWIDAITYVADGRLRRDHYSDSPMVDPAIDAVGDKASCQPVDQEPMFIASGNRPAALRWATSGWKYLLGLTDVWLLPDVLDCPTELRMAQQGDILYQPLYLACAGAKRIFAFRPKSVKGTTRAANTVWSHKAEYTADPALVQRQLRQGVLYLQIGEDASGRVCAYDATTGRRLFCRPSGGRFDVQGSILYVPTAHGVEAYAAFTGDALWAFDETRDWSPEAAIEHERPRILPSDGVVVFVQAEKNREVTILGLDEHTGGVRYRMSVSGAHVEVHQGSLIVLSSTCLRTFDVKTGQDKNTAALVAPTLLVVREGMAYVADVNSVVAIRIKTGKRAWSRKLGRTRDVASLWFDEDSEDSQGDPILVAGTGAQFYQLSPSDGTVLSHDDGTQEQPEKDSPKPYHDTAGSEFDERWEVDGYIGIAVGKTTVSGIDLRRDPENSHLKIASGPAPRWTGAKKKSSPLDAGP